MAGTIKQIIGSFEDIGKDIARETGKVPGEVIGKALESLGTSSQKSQQGNSVTSPNRETPKPPEKKLPPREWLAELAGKNKQQEPTVQERLEREKQEKNEKEARQAAVAKRMAPIVTGSSKAKRGNLYGIKQKASSEMSKNVRQD
ncbi:hypothetical protein A2363_04035 [Candidatus Gottesmanbacteria bacterium RIFOXYB1_FULL_47_11]|uniref:Uncharacterized protein n=1 Tax=Candidatus Gottesmanbacteria bacterium RIFOXYB1_FULL_47_11 TaxID=1798401 RepID=A0A1F6BDU1_9BACT|nr:MAG: hypothetical protein A2363_04035 [Candidatus Gottesmanbacteria bacterium RIFOXYB1_FULL_47_11]